ncbi:MAG: 3-deoxy-manno-octulosonate cytidylyltransferase [Candidatus Methylacidiphilales bacterium]
MKALVVIPARFASTRFPGKMLASLCGRPLIEHVWSHAVAAQYASRVVVATDDERIASVIRTAGGEAVMTPPDLPSGTDRIEAALRLMERGEQADDVEWVVNIQGDEPLFTAEELDSLISQLGGGDMATLARDIEPDEDPHDSNLVKVVTDQRGMALYFSRAAIPHIRDPEERGAVDDSPIPYRIHLGIYAYRREILHRLVQWPPSPLEKKEKLEQLRALENGVSIRVIPTRFRSKGVDVPEDISKVEARLAEVKKTSPVCTNSN